MDRVNALIERERLFFLGEAFSFLSFSFLNFFLFLSFLLNMINIYISITIFILKIHNK